MTTNEIRDLIEKKLVGQGSMIDVGGVLPAVLLNLLDLIDEGGGGTSDAVQYIPQELTAEQQAQARTNIGAGTYSKPSGGIPASDLASGVIPDDMVKYSSQTLTTPQQMQARKNQGLYYSEGGGEDVIITWDGDTTGLESVDIGGGAILYKVSDDAPQKELVKSLGMTAGGVEQIIDIPQQSIIPIEGGYGIGDAYVIVATESEASLDSYTFTKGIWFVKGTGNYVSKFTYGATETIHHIEPKYIKDMYYEETSEGEIDVNIPGGADEWPYPDSIYVSGMDYLKVSGETPQQSDITAIFKIESQDTTVAGADLEIKTTPYGSKLIAYQAPDSNLAETKFLIVPEDTTIEGVPTPKGIYFPQISSYANNHIESVSFPGTITTIHQIPAKYIPQTVPAVKMTIPSSGNAVYYNMAHIVLNEYVSSRDVVFSVEGRTVEYIYVWDVTTGISNDQQGDTYNFGMGGLYWVQLELDYEEGLFGYMCAMVYVEDNQ